MQQLVALPPPLSILLGTSPGESLLAFLLSVSMSLFFEKKPHQLLCSRNLGYLPPNAFLTDKRLHEAQVLADEHQGGVGSPLWGVTALAELTDALLTLVGSCQA